MTRRARTPRRTLSVDAYIHRATLGLPREQRLDAAAELRTHLQDRIAEHQAQGFSPEEAEYLAVKGMGEPRVTNRELLGHFFTTPLGWAVLGVIVTGWVGWQVMQTRDATRLRWGAPPSMNDFSNGGALPTTYTRFTFRTPPGTRFVEIAWLGTLGAERATLAAGPGVSGEVFYSRPTWRDWWATRTPLPYADQPWASTCRDQQPVHVQLTLKLPDMGVGLRQPNSNLNGLLWCSGLPLPLSRKGSVASGLGSGSSQAAAAQGGLVEVQHWDGGSDRGRLRLNHWTLLNVIRDSDHVTYRDGQTKEQNATALFVIRPSDSEQPAHLPTSSYDPQADRWTVQELKP